MGTETRMSKYYKALIALALVPALAQAECYTRSSMVIQPKEVSAPPTDIERLITPSGKDTIQCVVKFRVGINGKWESAEGRAVGSKGNEDLVCQHAVNLESAHLLVAQGTRTMQAEQQMVCYDGPEYNIRKVNIGDIVHDSEVEQHTKVKKYYAYQNTQCRYYAEHGISNDTVAFYQGTMCRIDTGPSPRWQIMDKW